MITNTLDGRLLSAADFVRAGAVLADVGTDHAYLPIFLLKSGRIKRAVCSDINEGPLNSAIANARDNGVSALCDFVLTDGAAGLDNYGITDMAVCGMGGELIADIIDRAAFVRDNGVRLILQPMSKHSHLRSYLAENGFSVLDERYSFSGGKYYTCILAEYTAEIRTVTDAEAELGADIPHTIDRDEYIGFLEAKRRRLTKVIEGKRQGGESSESESALLSAVELRLDALK